MRLLIAGVLAAVGLVGADAVPSWVREAAKQAVASYPGDVTAVVLFQEEHLTVAVDGRRTIRERAAIRIVQPSRNSIRAGRSYNAKTGRIREIQGWFLPASGKETMLGKDEAVDVALSQSDAYSEYRAKSLECPQSAGAGSVFAYEIVEEEKSVFTQYYYDFQDRSPVLVSRFVLTLPAGWKATAVPFNRPELQATTAGDTQTWELRNLPWIEAEDYSPGTHAVAPWVGVTWSADAPNVRAMKDWGSVSAWLSGLADPAVVVTDAVAAKAAELVRGSMTEFDKIHAIGAFVQATNYVSVQTNIGRGGGYEPHPAGDVLKRNYGDCKDKSTLMRALLKATGIDAYMISIYSGDRQRVKPEWPSSLQFNHAIVAVRVGETTTAPAVLVHEKLGRLLFFDPTASKTRVGDLPRDEQGSFALVLAGDRGELVKAPLLPAETHRVESEIEGQLNLNAAFSGKLVRRYFGESGTAMRYRTEEAKALRELFEQAFSRQLGGVTIASVQGADEADRYEANVEFGADRFGQLMQGRLLMVRPGTLAAGNDYGFAAKERKLPIRISARVRKDSVRIKLPAGFVVDELPDPVTLEGEFGKYEATWKVAEEQIAFEQTVEINEVLAPASEYEKLRKFFDQMAAGQASAVVLLKR